jgi:hypothetical protein
MRSSRVRNLRVRSAATVAGTAVVLGLALGGVAVVTQ